MKKKSLRDEIINYAKEKYDTIAEYPWARDPESAVLRHDDNRKWYGLVMTLKGKSLGLMDRDYVDIINLKGEPEFISFLRGEKGYLPAYHMNKSKWITILLDGTVKMDTITSLLDTSFELTARKGSLGKSGVRCHDWIVPANPKYYDVEKGFEESDTISWKQSNNIEVGDIVYIYMGAPYSEIQYKCQAVEVNIPYDYDDGKVTMSRVMHIKLLKKYNKGLIGRDILREHGVYAVRGPRSMPKSLIEEIERIG